MRRLMLAMVGAVLVAACAPRSADLTDADRAAIRQRLDDVARHITTGDYQAWADDFTEDGVFMIANSPPIHGRAAMKAWIEAGPRVTSISFSDIAISGSGALAWATSAISVSMEGTPGPDRSKQLVVFERQADGSWLAAAASVSSDTPLPGT